MIVASSSKSIHARMKAAFTSARLNVMTQTLCAKEGSLPQGLMIQNTYTKMCNGSKSITIMVRNGMAYPQTLKQKISVAKISSCQLSARAMHVAWHDRCTGWGPGVQTPKITTEQIWEKLFLKLHLSGLASWLPELEGSTRSLHAQYHIFFLESCKLSCTHLTEHVIKVTDDTLFKEWFRQIPPPLVEEVHAHLQEILDSGAICPSQSAWCKTVVLVHQKDGSLHFCIDFCHLNTHMKKDSYPLPRIQEALKSLVSAGQFSCLDLKPRFWQIKMDKLSKQYTTFTVGNLGFFECDCMPFGLCNAPATFQRLMQRWI